jgi:hypothetical protein
MLFAVLLMLLVMLMVMIRVAVLCRCRSCCLVRIGTVKVLRVCVCEKRCHVHRVCVPAYQQLE